MSSTDMMYCAAARRCPVLTRSTLLPSNVRYCDLLGCAVLTYPVLLPDSEEEKEEALEVNVSRGEVHLLFLPLRNQTQATTCFIADAALHTSFCMASFNVTTTTTTKKKDNNNNDDDDDDDDDDDNADHDAGGRAEGRGAEGAVFGADEDGA
eukprot:2222613-Rhodomonas_salina.1